MAQYQALAPGVQVNGQTVLSVVDAMGAFKASATKILEQSGLKDVVPDQWYQQQSWLNAFREISAKLGPSTLRQIGNKIPENAKFPPGIDTIDKALGAIDVAYHMNHRNGEIGHYKFTLTSDRSAKIVCNNPYPCEFDRGIIEAMAGRFKPQGAVLRVTHDDTQPCRKNGADTCTYLITW